MLCTVYQDKHRIPPHGTFGNAKRTWSAEMPAPLRNFPLGGFAMSDLRRLTRGFGLSLLVGISGLVSGLSGVAWAQGYPPDGPNFPTVTLNEGTQGAAGLPPVNVPPPKGWDQQSIWNMQVVGFNDNQGRASSDDGWAENQNGRYILYVTDNGSDTPT